VSDETKRSAAAALKGRLRRYPALYRTLRSLLLPINRRLEVSRWRRAGRPVPPPHAFKQLTIDGYRRAFRLATLVETGTYLGDTVEAQRKRFRKVVSIELSPDLCRAAQSRFANMKNVTVLEGDSADLLESVVAQLRGPALFWLDGHYSAGITAQGGLDTPVQRELEIILGSPENHVILVDDARCFGSGDYPTLDGVRALVGNLRPDWACVVEDDIIRISARHQSRVGRRGRRSGGPGAHPTRPASGPGSADPGS
jgi:hypothetical protein